MSNRDLKYSINWEDARQAIRSERAGRSKVTFDPDYFKSSAGDFSKRVQTNDYEFGRKPVEIIDSILDNSMDVLEIGPGPGTLTIPLSKKVRSITCIDTNPQNIAHLQKNLDDSGCSNVKIIQADWTKMNDSELADSYDLVVCSHFLWMIPDLKEHIIRMENAARKYCVIIQPAGRSNFVKKVYEEIVGVPYRGEFEPDADYFAYVIVREWGRLCKVDHYSFTNSTSPQERLRMTAGFIGRFKEVDNEVAKRIMEMIEKEIPEDGFFTETNHAVVMWWSPDKSQ
ncbi:MAG: class I SAM-dependent methyltransferase [Methanomicrobiales archaeon]|nr:class I SAM-dependent methyltransferase [Methanomicrobiales archaeon]